ncbi:aldo/keto reductase (plasmid) [Microvirga ossetica]|uniref:Aldo/keto reductase n=1 Tax=Microvirga ossetica TaxID=1882682 RepID=A0A1B2EQU3_9HYPH|nr:aldo/keto reductase [Microvirga ossetica]ANY82329.1 aldo/keto reductase [Microvirga ossetica]
MVEIPKLGLGTYGRTGEAGIAAILKTLEIGYRHIDTAQSYDTEAGVGEAVRRSGVSRSEIFITTKVADTNLEKSQFIDSVERSLETIGLGPVDLLLIHWPSKNDAVPFEDYMLALAEAQRRGHTRLIGVSNFPIALLERTERLLGKGAIATNQVEIHPYMQAPKLIAHARRKDLTLTAYQPLCQGAVASDPVLQRIGGKHGVAASAAALAFLMAEGHAVIPASANEVNLRANWQARAVTLDSNDMQAIRALHRGERSINPDKSPAWDD